MTGESWETTPFSLTSRHGRKEKDDFSFASCKLLSASVRQRFTSICEGTKKRSKDYDYAEKWIQMEP
ncbi:hypothetical protein OUZ56_021461 [Daphnia magna]|uniref:Uncharacterized protein n=1 Tax=Daphnia magna TaxID=35525 RepID=A0ABQ9ZHF5_9CRUS|nr:hypothetical protein OUZ56_021461 [Daphnia magna]